MNAAIAAVCISQGVLTIGALIGFAFRAGRVLEKVEAHEERIDNLERWRNRAHRFTDPKEVPHA